MKIFACAIGVIAMVASVESFTATSPNFSRSIVSSRQSTEIRAVAKKTTKKAATKKAAKKEEDTVETLRKPEFIASIAEKTGMTKADSEAALAAVLETITEVCIESS
jgi:Sec7-like guanine-nucleotide exchange factor